jgi:poly(A) polymerase
VQIPGVPESLLAALLVAARGCRLALVGGAVRDLLLHRQHQDPWRGLPDLDLVVEGRAIELIEPLKAELYKIWGDHVQLSARVHGRYQTVELELQLSDQTWLLDLASARHETYLRPAWNPDVELGCLEDDLVRRDFTVNAIALDLQTGGLIDPFSGQDDLARRQLRFLHAKSLSDDPSRLIRAARYAARLQFDMAPESLVQIKDSLREWPWPPLPIQDPEMVPPALGVRLRRELELLLEKEPWQQALEFLQRCGGFALLDQSLQHDSTWSHRLTLANHYQLPRLLCLIAASKNACDLASRLQLPQSQQKLLVQMQRLTSQLQSLERSNASASLPASVWCQILEDPIKNPSAVALAYVTGAQPTRALHQWLESWQYVRSPVDGATLRREGWAQGKLLGDELKRRRMNALDLMPRYHDTSD